jgi:hypothetical protein
MDLALELGQPLTVIARMSERELARWARYIARRGLPMRRLELGLAQIAKLIGETMGGMEGVSIDDFLFYQRQEEGDDEELTAEELEELKAGIGFAPEKNDGE